MTHNLLWVFPASAKNKKSESGKMLRFQGLVPPSPGPLERLVFLPDFECNRAFGVSDSFLGQAFSD